MKNKILDHSQFSFSAKHQNTKLKQICTVSDDSSLSNSLSYHLSFSLANPKFSLSNDSNLQLNLASILHGQSTDQPPWPKSLSSSSIYYQQYRRLIANEKVFTLLRSH